jgi:hypothetical protein
MAVMIKLHLPGGQATLSAVEGLPGLAGVKLDQRFGVVRIDPTNSLYVARTDTIDNVEERRKLSPEILGVYGDVRISTT